MAEPHLYSSIILVDADEEFSNRLLSFLLQYKYSLRYHKKAEPALEDFRNNPTESVIISRSLPGFNGLSLLREIQREKQAPSAILVVSEQDRGTALSEIAGYRCTGEVGIFSRSGHLLELLDLLPAASRLGSPPFTSTEERIVLEFIRGHRGVHLAELCRELRMRYSKTTMILKHLTTSGLLIECDVGNRRCYYANESPPNDLDLLPEVSQGIIRHLLNGPKQQGALHSSLGVSRSSITFHLKELRHSNWVDVDRKKDGNVVRLVRSVDLLPRQ